VTVQAALDSGQVLTRWRLVDDLAWHDFGGEITIPAQSAVVVI
jgi:hypothetical protein